MRDVGLRPRRPCAVRRKAGWLGEGTGPAPDDHTESLAHQPASPHVCLLPPAQRKKGGFHLQSPGPGASRTGHPKPLPTQPGAVITSTEQLEYDDSSRLPARRTATWLARTPGHCVSITPPRTRTQAGTQSNPSACSQLPLHSLGYQVTRGCRVGDR